MEYAYPMMKAWVEWIDRQDAAKGKRTYLFDTIDTFGDWLALDGTTSISFKGSTDDSYVSTMYYYRSVQIVSKMAECLGKEADQIYYAELEKKIKAAILHEYFTPGGRLAVWCQSGGCHNLGTLDFCRGGRRNQ